jgi:hypothetical protein
MKKQLKALKAATKKPKPRPTSSKIKKLENPLAPLAEVLASPSSQRLMQKFNVSSNQFLSLVLAMYHVHEIALPQRISLSPVGPKVWKKVTSLGDLFVLYRSGDEYIAEFSEKLAALDSRLRKANDEKGYEQVSTLQRAIFSLLLRKRLGQPIHSLDSSILDDLTDTIGALISEAWFNVSEGGSQNKADDLKLLFGRAVDGLIRLKYPSKAKHSGKQHQKARVAIAFARELCGKLRRLPTKSEVRSLMEEKKYGFADERSRAASKWKDLFKRSSLEALKD